MEPVIAYIGDDFTGSIEVLETLQWAGVKTVLFLKTPTATDLSSYADCQAVGVATQARFMTPERMDAALGPLMQELQSLSPKFLHYKTSSTADSSPRIGSIGKAIELGRARCGGNKVPVLIAAPSLGRHQAFGNLFATQGEPSKIYRLDRHPVARYHPITPMYEADVRAHLSLQTNLPIELVDCLQLPQPLMSAWGTTGEIVLFDALTDQDVVVFGQYCHDMASHSTPIFLVGSSDIESGLLSNWKDAPPVDALPAQPLPEREPSKVAQMLVLSGSYSPVNERQILWARQAGFDAIEIETALLVDPETRDAELERVIDLAVKSLGASHNLIMHSVLGPSDRRRNQLMNAFAKLGLEQEQIQLENAKRLGPILGELVSQVLSRHPVQRLGLSGGDTSIYVARHLGIVAIEALVPLAPGAPLCRVHAPNAFDGLEVIFKSGQAGDEHFWKNASKR